MFPFRSRVVADARGGLAFVGPQRKIARQQSNCRGPRGFRRTFAKRSLMRREMGRGKRAMPHGQIVIKVGS